MIISEHAIERYQKRIEKVTKPEAFKRLNNKQLRKMIKVFGANGCFPLDDCRAVVRNNVVATVYPKKSTFRYKRQR